MSVKLLVIVILVFKRYPTTLTNAR